MRSRDKFLEKMPRCGLDAFDAGGGAPVHPWRAGVIILSIVLLPWPKRRNLPASVDLPIQGSFPMITASKAFIAFCLLAVGGTVLVIGPTELRRLLPSGAKTDIAAKPEAKARAKAETKVELKPEEPKLAASSRRRRQPASRRRPPSRRRVRWPRRRSRSRPRLPISHRSSRRRRLPIPAPVSTSRASTITARRR